MSDDKTRAELRRAASRIRDALHDKKAATWDSAESEVLRDRLDEIDAFISGLDGVPPQRWRMDFEAETAQARREDDPEWSEHVRLAAKFGGGQP
jgi:hypothetical protein